MTISAFFTLPDPELTQESSVDPMGIQVIWTHYGQQIFDEKLTTVANDLRAFSLNLFHQHLLLRLQMEHAEVWQQARITFNKWNTDLNVKTGLLIFLEDLVTWIFHEQYKIDPTAHRYTGILGMNKANRLAAGNNRIQLIASKGAGLLKNQINLGTTGRYKGPMMKMGFFNRAFEVRETPDGVWPKVHQLLKDWDAAEKLEDRLITFLCQEVLVAGRQADYPRKDLDAIKNSPYWKPLSDGYLDCFGKASQHTALKDFWKSQLGLDKGAAWALYEVVSTESESRLSYHDVMAQALSNEQLTAAEKLKIQNILELEPFLSHSEYLLRFLAQRDVKKLADHLEDLKTLREVINNSGNFSLSGVSVALSSLHAVMINAKDFEAWIKGILSYHDKIMNARGGNAWLTLGANDVVQHHFSPSLHHRDIVKYLEEKPWFHTYYIETLRSIQGGLNA